DELSYDMESVPLKEMEERMIYHTLDRTEGNRTHAAKLLGISVLNLHRFLKQPLFFDAPLFS
ncbi:MAG: helix-turn-helix domain-containing protein, partial [Desulfamplus sp.]|nr:helix-turn-helix domain-containing protein [Desulfamplus sp.]